MEGALHKGSDSSENIPYYSRTHREFFDGVAIAVVDQNATDANGRAYRDTVEAGGYFRGSLGAEFPVAENLTFSSSIGFLYDEIMGQLLDGSGGNAFISFKTTVVDFLGFYNLGRHRIGLGGSFHYNPKYDYKEIGNNFRLQTVAHFSNALGASIQYDYLVSQNTTMGIRYTNISYDFENIVVSNYVGSSGDYFSRQCESNCEDLVDASSISGHITYRF